VDSEGEQAVRHRVPTCDPSICAAEVRLIIIINMLMPAAVIVLHI
jgi:hypothetical protein